MGKGVGSFFKFILNVPKGMLLLEVFPNVLVREKLLRKSLIIASKKFSLGVKLSKKNVIFIQ
jgi:ribosomal protein L16/L10AE